MEDSSVEKDKILCLHGYRTSGSFLRKQLSKWDLPTTSMFSQFHLEFPDGFFPAGGKSDIEGYFPPPYFEWFHHEKDFTVYENLEECISYLCDYLITNGPFHGLLGFSQACPSIYVFSQIAATGSVPVPIYKSDLFSSPLSIMFKGACLAALILGYHAQGKILKDHPPMKLFVSISGTKFKDPSICEVAYKDPIKVKSVHFIGDKDWLKIPSQQLASAFEDPLIISHPQGHTVPRLDEEALKKLSNWIADVGEAALHVGNGVLNENKSAVEEAEKTQKEECGLQEEKISK